MDDLLDQDNCRQYMCSSTKSRHKRKLPATKTERRPFWGDVEGTLGLHGVRRIKPGQRSVFCSFLWSLILTVGVALFGFAVSQRVNYYLSYPSSWSVHFNPEQNEWPALTLCNLNPVRVTQLVSHYGEGVHEKSHQSEFVWESFLERNPHLNSHQFFLSNAHIVEEMIIRCDAGSVACSSANFSLILTEQGLCYKLKPDRATQVLELTVNAETYQYVEGLAQSTGMKIYVHEQQTVVRDDAHFLVYPGHHFDVTLGREEFTYLEPPYGSCVSDGVTDIRSCWSECFMHKVQSLCYCRPFWYSEHLLDSPECSIQTHFTCVKDAMTNYEGSQLPFCQCPMSCEFSTHTTQIHSYPKAFDPVDDYMDTSKLKNILQQYHKAQSVQTSICKRHASLLQAFLSVYQETVSSTTQFEADFHKVVYSTKAEYEDMSPRIHFHTNIGLKGVESMLDKGYSSHWRALKEGELHQIKSTYQTVLGTYNKVITRLRFNTLISFDLAKLLYAVVDVQLSVKTDLTTEAIENLTSLYYALLDGKPLGTFEITPDRRYDSALIPCGKLEGHQEALQTYFNGLSNSLELYVADISQLKGVLTGLIGSKKYNESNYLALKEKFIQHCHETIQATRTFEKHVISKCEKNIQTKIEEMSHLKHRLNEQTDAFEKRVNSLENALGFVNSEILKKLKPFAGVSDADCSSLNISWLVESLDNKSIRALMYQIDTLIFDLRMSHHKMLPSMDSLQESITAVWKTMFNEELLKEFYTMLKSDVMDMIGNPNQVTYFTDIFYSERMLNRTVGDNQTGLALDRLMVHLNADIPLKEFQTKSQNVQQTFTEMLNTVSKYKDIIKLLQQLRSGLDNIATYFQQVSDEDISGRKFAQENLLSIRFVKHAASYVQWTQQPAYTTEAMLGEIGGLMVLMLGASMLSLLEVCDIIFTWIAHKLCTKRDKGPHSEKPPETWDKPKSLEKLAPARNMDLNSSLHLHRKSHVTFKDFNNIHGSEV